MKSRIAILGSTGTIGVNTLDVAARHPDRFEITALCANTAVDLMEEQCVAHRPRYAVMVDARAASELSQRLRNRGLSTEVLDGTDALAQVAALDEVDQVMAAIVGAAGLMPTLAAARAGKRVLLANKESLVMAGSLFMAEIDHAGAELIPIDSEHNAVFQCLPDDYRCGHRPPGVRRIMLTASGGPFRDMPLESLASVTPAQAVKHPNWVMGRKISVDSATMMNKGLELIEAAWLFGMEESGLQAVLHPQSIVHSMVEYADGSILAQMGQPDMRTPIAQAMASPDRVSSGVEPLELWRAGALEFREPEVDRFPCLGLAQSAMAAGGCAPAVLNAANEEAVAAFLDERLAYLGIAPVIEHCLEAMSGAAAVGRAPSSLEDVLAADEWARRVARERIDAQAH